MLKRVLRGCSEGAQKDGRAYRVESFEQIEVEFGHGKSGSRGERQRVVEAFGKAEQRPIGHLISWEIMEDRGSSWELTGDHGRGRTLGMPRTARTWEITEDHGSSMEITGDHGRGHLGDAEDGEGAPKLDDGDDVREAEAPAVEAL